MEILNSTINDLELIFSFFGSAIEYQKKNGFELWPQFSREMIEKEIAGKRHWKIMDDEKVLCVFSVMYNDPVIWMEKDKDPAVYLHRIAVNPEFKGKGMVSIIKEWAIGHAKEKHKKYLRMDTWGHNETIRNYYIKCGFNYIGQQYLTRTEGSPEHYGGSVLSLFENKIL
jgi:ribosomal protein S18 acetylase RimI-like enzyme